ncbi:U1biquitin-specific peptidase-like protein [Calycina marina]|uniref:Ubiquitin carboxyl-terminal hydrolase n=1 Tax=Calycina marina TaxID=1763456 RepID=A0A9P7ZAW4_9HELO|nr:U1biquitin-specific peptidase-like protein [Calycina marina]
MSEKPLTIVHYAAGASLAAIAAIYVFSPNFFLDGDDQSVGRKKSVVGLSNSGNDCFINSVLQALAGLGDLRTYLIRETHRRKLDGPGVYTQLVEDPARKSLSPAKLEGLQSGLITHGLKDILDALNERPLYKKTISAGHFISCLETAFKQRISRQQQDAQEFLQVVAERLCDEYHAGHRVRRHMKSTIDESIKSASQQSLAVPASEHKPRPSPTRSTRTQAAPDILSDLDTEDGFPFEGGSESQIECQTCRFKPKATKTTFCSLTLSVPQVNSTSLSSCFDQMFKTEDIEDFKCEKCRLLHAMGLLKDELAKSNSEKFKQKTQQFIEKLQVIINTDPEQDLGDLHLPGTKYAPKRTIKRYVRINKFPKIVAIHLSRSIFDTRTTMKNSAKVVFPEKLPLGGLADRRTYRLLSVVCHKGSHHSGHYESFRRQNIYPPFTTPNAFRGSNVYSRTTTPIPSQMPTPQLKPTKKVDDSNSDNPTLSSMPGILSPVSAVSRNSLALTDDSFVDQLKASGPTPAPRDPETSSLRSVARSARDSISKMGRRNNDDRSMPLPTTASPINNGNTSRVLLSETARGKKKKPASSNRWWRISDEKISETKTKEVLAMQKEVYMLFYELEKDS